MNLNFNENDHFSTGNFIDIQHHHWNQTQNKSNLTVFNVRGIQRWSQIVSLEVFFFFFFSFERI